MIVGVIQLTWVSFDEPEKDHLPILPLDPRIWIVVTIVGIFGVIQQLCVIGKNQKLLDKFVIILHVIYQNSNILICGNFLLEMLNWR